MRTNTRKDAGSAAVLEPMPASDVDEPARDRTAAEGEVALLSLQSIRLGPNSRPDGELGDLDELAASIRAQGLLNPVLVRPVTGGYELVCGTRRLRACETRLGWSQIRALVRDLTDDEARSANIVENLQRQGVSPLALAEGMQILTRPPYELTAQQIGRQIGKPTWYVQRALEVLTLPATVVDGIRSGALPWSAAQQLLVVADRDLRDRHATRLLKEPRVDLTPGGVRRWIDEQLSDLGKAPFDLSDSELVPTAGSCDVCPYRARNLAQQVPLFAGASDDAPDTCTRPSCYAEKAAAHFERLAAAHRMGGGAAVITKQAKALFEERYFGPDRRLRLKWGADYVDLDEPYNGGRQSLRDIAGELPVSLVALARDPAGAPRYLVHKKAVPAVLKAAGVKSGPSGAPPAAPLSEADKTARRKKQLANAIGSQLRERLFDEIDVRLAKSLSDDVLAWAVGRLIGGLRQEAKYVATRQGWSPKPRDNNWDAHVRWLQAHVAKSEAAEVRRVLVGLAAEIGRSHFEGPAAAGGEADVAKLLGIDVPAIRKEVEEPLRALAAEREAAIKAKAARGGTKKAKPGDKPKKGKKTEKLAVRRRSKR